MRNLLKATLYGACPLLILGGFVLALALVPEPAAAAQPKGFRAKVVVINRTGHDLDFVLEGTSLLDGSTLFLCALPSVDGGKVEVKGLPEDCDGVIRVDSDRDGTTDFDIPFLLDKTIRVTINP